MSAHLAAADITLGLLAGGRGSRLGGVDKAWIERDGVPQVLRLARRWPGETGAVLVSANRDPGRYAAAALETVPDRLPAGSGPLAGIEALAAACRTPWLLTVPVDIFDANDCLVRTLVSCRDADGAVAEDADGLQPLVALYREQALRQLLPATLADGELAPRRVQARLEMATVRFAGVRFGNLNTPEDLAALRLSLPRAWTGRSEP